MKGQENLIPQNQRTKEEQRNIARMGGVASGKVRRHKKQLRELVEHFGTIEVSDSDKDKLQELGIKPEMMTNDMKVVISLYGKAMCGDVAAFNAIRDIKGEKPTENMAVSLPNVVEVRIIQAQRNDFASSESEITD